MCPYEMSESFAFGKEIYSNIPHVEEGEIMRTAIECERQQSRHHSFHQEQNPHVH